MTKFFLVYLIYIVLLLFFCVWKPIRYVLSLSWLLLCELFLFCCSFCSIINNDINFFELFFLLLLILLVNCLSQWMLWCCFCARVARGLC